MIEEPYPWRGSWQWGDDAYGGIERGIEVFVEKGDSADVGVFDLCICAYEKPGIDAALAGVADFAASHVIEHPHLYGLKRIGDAE